MTIYVEELRGENKKLRAFAQAVMEGWPSEDGIGACELEEIAVIHGLLEARKVTEPCNEECDCAVFGNLPGVCHFKTPLLTGKAVPRD